METPDRQTTRSRLDFWDRYFIAAIPVSRELVLYAALFLIAAALRIWDLGPRMIHHDESLHAVYSWYYYRGKGYIHDPMMHGPWQFHAMALSYFLFGASDVTARLSHALFGSVLAILPFFLRSQMGRTGAFIAACFIALSPSFLYFSRFAREDAFAITWTALVVVGATRYLRERRSFDLYLAVGALSLFYCTKENSYIFTGILVLFLLIHSFVTNRWEIYHFLRHRTTPSPSGELAVVLTTMVLPLFTGFVIALAHLLGIPSVSNEVLYFTLVVLMIISAGLGLRWDAEHWVRAAAVFWGIFIILHTAFFSNPLGIGSGTIGSLQYWIAQQEVARGGQPWYYYLLLLPLYETVIVVFGLAGVVYWSRQRNLFALFLIYWIVLNTLIYAYTSEKMPWLVVHLALPYALLAGITVGKLVDSMRWDHAWRRGGLPFMIALVLAVLAVLALLGTQLPIGLPLSSQLAQRMVFHWIGLLIVSGILIGLTLHYGQRLGRSISLRLAALCALVILMAFSIRTAWQATFYNGDRPVEILVYVQTSPDVGKVVSEIERLAFRTGAGRDDFKVAYDSGVSWPFNWYLRDYHGANFFGRGLPDADAPVVLVSFEGDTQARVDAFLGDDYVRQRYHLRWWFPEDLYRDLTPLRIIDTLSDSDSREKLWRFLLYREVPRPLGSTDFVMYVRRDLATGPWAVGLATPAIPEVDPYLASSQVLPGTEIVGGWGQDEGQFDEPKNVAIAPDGNLYVLDTWNHRVQKFDPSGQFLLAWGSQGAAAGQFNEPWGLAIDSKGDIYVADTWNHRVQKFDGSGTFLARFGPDDGVRIGHGPGEFYGPRMIAVDVDDNLYVTDTGNHRVQKLDPHGNVLAIYGEMGNADGLFREPVGIALDLANDGHIYVADTWNRRIQRFDSSFRPVGQWDVAAWYGQSIANKPFLAIDPRGYVYASDPEKHRILMFTGTGTIVSVWGWLGDDDASLHFPTGLATDHLGGLLVADSHNHRIMRFEPIR